MIAVVSGGKGNDDIDNESFNVTIAGGDGADTIDNEGDKVSISGDAGNDAHGVLSGNCYNGFHLLFSVVFSNIDNYTYFTAVCQ